MSVDLPAPFSPTMAWTAPTLTVSSMPSLATTPGNRFTIPCSSMARPGGRTSVRPPAGFPSPWFTAARLRRLRHRDFTADDLLLVVVELGHDVVDVPARRRVPHAVDGQVEHLRPGGEG